MDAKLLLTAGAVITLLWTGGLISLAYFYLM